MNKTQPLAANKDLPLVRDSFWIHIICEVHLKALRKESPYRILDRAAALYPKVACMKGHRIIES